MERLVESLADLPPLLIYAAVAFATLVENAFPPMPSDVAVALGGFLAQRGALSPGILWAAAWGANVLGATGVYLLARRYGRAFLASRLGRRLVLADALIGVEREYIRFGLAGLFFSRLLPGFRSIVAPFFALVNLSPLAVLAPIALASAVWYWGLVWAGGRVGANWSEIEGFVGRLNLTLTLVAAAVTVAVGAWLWRGAVRRVPQRQRLLKALRRALVPGTGGSPAAADVDLAAQAAAALLHEITRADPSLSPAERESIEAHLRTRWQLQEALPSGISAEADTVTEPLGFSREERIALAERLYRIALGDGVLTLHERQIMQRAGDLLGLDAEDLAEARRRTQAA